VRAGRNRGRPVVAARGRQVQVVPVVELNLAECTDQAPLGGGGLAGPEVRVVDGHEVRVEELAAGECGDGPLPVADLVPHHGADAELLRQVITVDVQQRLHVDGACYVIDQVER